MRITRICLHDTHLHWYAWDYFGLLVGGPWMNMSLTISAKFGMNKVYMMWNFFAMAIGIYISICLNEPLHYSMAHYSKLWGKWTIYIALMSVHTVRHDVICYIIYSHGQKTYTVLKIACLHWILELREIRQISWQKPNLCILTYRLIFQTHTLRLASDGHILYHGWCYDWRWCCHGYGGRYANIGTVYPEVCYNISCLNVDVTSDDEGRGEVRGRGTLTKAFMDQKREQYQFHRV